MSRHKLKFTPEQRSLWANPTTLPGDTNRLARPLVQLIADSLLNTFPCPSQSPGGLSAFFEYSNQAQLPTYALPLPEHLEARVRDAFEREIPDPTSTNSLNSVPTLRVLTDGDLSDLSAGPCSPFVLGENAEIEREIRAAGCLYWFRIHINLVHIGEAVIRNSAVAIIEPTASVQIRPHPDVDSAPVIREALVACLDQAIERRNSGLQHSFIENAFPGGEGRVPNNHILTAGLLALNKAGKNARTLENGWRPNASGRPTYEYEPTKTKRISVYALLDDLAEEQVINTEKVWRFIEGLHPDTQDVALAVLAQMCEPSVGDKPRYPMLMPVPITDDAILAYKAVTISNRESARLIIHTAMDNLQALSFDVNLESPIPGGGWFWRGDRLFHIVKVQQYQEDIFGERKTVSTTWAVRAGLWACVWFNRDFRQYIGSMASVLLEFGSQRKRLLAKRIGQRLLLLSQVCQPRGVVTILVRTLLDDVGELPSPDHRRKNWASRTREYLEEALEMLQTCGVLRTVEWPDGFGPFDIDRAKGWGDRWLSARIRIITMASLRSQTATGKPPGPRRNQVGRSNTGAIAGPDIRFARVNIAPLMLQQQLALELGISRRHLSQIENARRKPSPMLCVKLRDWIRKRKKEETQAELS